jgi:CRISPR/Cas system CSM-associated protein Csm3 (group 7 of RAMP superfamily)
VPQGRWAGDASRRIVTRIVVTGELVLRTPAHFSNGDTDDLTDMPLLVDPLDGKSPLLTGASIAGALRSYLRAIEKGYQKPLPESQDREDQAAKAERQSATVMLFGGFRGDDYGEQSPLIVDDALGTNFGIEMREGVRIKPESRTAEENKLFDLQLWQAGTTFPLRFELLIREGQDPDMMKQGLATALSGLSNGGIPLGARKRRGYGQVRVAEWRVSTYDLKTADGLLAWIAGVAAPGTQCGSDIHALLGVMSLDDTRQAFTWRATFSLDGSLLIRSGSGRDDTGPDWVHLQARQAGGDFQPVLSGTSLGGALRARALKIAKTLDARERSQILIDALFGVEIRQGVQPRASRVMVQESAVHNVRVDLVQNRVSIDRFTGGARNTALFNEQPAFGGDDSVLTLELQLANPEDHEIGLLLLLLKDLWTGDLPVGGESSVGRGRLKGQSAMLIYQAGNSIQGWQVVSTGQGLSIAGDRSVLQSYVVSLNKYLQEATQ